MKINQSTFKFVTFYLLLIHSNLLHAGESAWNYTAIPYTDWGYDPFIIEPDSPAQWPTNAAPNYYYVEPKHPLASDQEQGGELTGDYGRLGYTYSPSLTIPSSSWFCDVY
jgi:hypothetical protein